MKIFAIAILALVLVSNVNAQFSTCDSSGWRYSVPVPDDKECKTPADGGDSTDLDILGITLGTALNGDAFCRPGDSIDADSDTGLSAILNAGEQLVLACGENRWCENAGYETLTAAECTTVFNVLKDVANNSPKVTGDTYASSSNGYNLQGCSLGLDREGDVGIFEVRHYEVVNFGEDWKAQHTHQLICKYSPPMYITGASGCANGLKPEYQTGAGRIVKDSAEHLTGVGSSAACGQLTFEA